MRDPYVVMGLRPDAEPDVVKAAYRTLARKYHPDVAGPAGEARMKTLTAAYAVLSDPVQRAAWDSQRQPAPAQSGAAETWDATSSPRRRPRGWRIPELRPAATVALLVAGALTWHLYLHQAWRPSLALAYPVAALPSGVRAWARWARPPRLAEVPSDPGKVDINLAGALGHAALMAVGGVVICPMEFAWIVLVRPVARAIHASWVRRQPRGWCP